MLLYSRPFFIMPPVARSNAHAHQQQPLFWVDKICLTWFLFDGLTHLSLGIGVAGHLLLHRSDGVLTA